MSEEEIIERFKILITNLEDNKEYYLYDISQKVLDLYNKEKEELQRQINTRIINEEFIEKNYISKDKIKEKIKSYEGLKIMDKSAYEEQVKPLKELLEE